MTSFYKTGGSLQSLRSISRRLWVRLSIAFAVIVLVGVMAANVVSLLLTITKINNAAGEEDYWSQQMNYQFIQPGGVIDSLEMIYERNQNWDGIQNVMDVVQSFNVPSTLMMIGYIFTDEDGTVFYNSVPEDLSLWKYDSLNENFPISVNGVERGRLRVIAKNNLGEITPTYSEWDYFLEWMKEWVRTRMAWMLLIIVVLGVVFGVFISRSMTAPLRRLAEAAEAIGSRDLSKRVDVNGSEEVLQLATSFNEMAQDLENAEYRRRNLLADVAHELRNPLSVLQGNLRAMLDQVYPMNAEEVAKLYNQTRLLSRLVNDLHEIAQAEAGKLPMQKRNINLAEVVYNVADTFELIAEDEEVKLQVDIPSHLPVYGDPARLAQVLHNLLANALHHTPAGGQIELMAEKKASLIQLRIKDSGHGIAPEHLPQVFERFYRADRSRSRNKGGAGLGLAISKAIVEAHEGRITAFSEGIHMGSVFTVELQLVSTAENDEVLLRIPQRIFAATEDLS